MIKGEIRERMAWCLEQRLISSLIYPYCPNIAKDMAKQLSYDIYTKYDDITTSNIKAGRLIGKEDIHPVFLRVDSELADKSKAKV